MNGLREREALPEQEREAALKTQKRPNRLARVFRGWWMVLLGPLAWLMLEVSKIDPWMTEHLYSGTIYPIFAGWVGFLTSFLPFSLMEAGICAAVVGAPTLLVLAAMKKIRIPWRKLPGWGIRLGCVLLFLFALLCGMNYHRPEFAAFSGLSIQDSPVEELEALCLELTARANELRPLMQTDERGVTQLSASTLTLCRQARQTFAKLAQDYDVLPNLPITPKPVVNSWWMSMIQITGVFSPWTYEANINIDAPDFTVPATASHELAHTRGFMREDEANFIAYLACNRSEYPEFQYSGVMLALVHASNRLYSADYDAFLRVNERMSEGVHLDFADNNAYWDRFKGPVAEISDAVNDTYLKVNSQPDGVQSYGRMVDLLLADFRQRHSHT